MQEESLKKKAFKGVFWKIGEQGASQGIQLVISVVLARLILPEQFGVLAMLGIFIAVARVFIDSGFSQALMRKTNRTQEDCCTVFYFNIIVSLTAYAILFLIAPWVADFYNMPELKPLMRVFAISIVIGSLSAVQRTIFAAELRFKELTKFNLISQSLSGAFGIFLAYNNFQVWTLVWQQMFAEIISGIFIWYKSSWRPKLIFSLAKLKEFFTFGSRLLASGLLDTIYGNMYSVIIGKFFSASALAYFGRADSLKRMTSSMPTGILQSVTYPTLCKLQDNDDALRNGYRRTLRVSAFVVFPLCVGMGAVAYPLINVLYTFRWIYAASLLTIICFAGMWYPIHAINLNLLLVKGKSDFFLKLEIIKKICGVIMLFITVPLGLKAMCIGMVCTSINALIINTYYTGKLINLGFIRQMRDFAHIIFLALAMFFLVRLFIHYAGIGLLGLVGGFIIGAGFYTGGAFLFRFPEVKELLNWNK